VGVVILGMHRGGTSALAGAVHHLGLDAGDDAALIGATEANRRGHWEIASLSELNEQLLRELGGRWGGPPVVDPDRLTELARGPWGVRARRTFLAGLRGERWVWKDPRLCLLLPFWRQVLGQELVVVATVRPAAEVARSLEARDGFAIAYGLALWERYQREAARAVGDLPLYVVPYDELLDDPGRELRALASFLTAHGHEIDLDETLAEALAFLDPGERHHGDVPGLDAMVEASDAQRALAGLLAAARGERTGGWLGDLPPETPNLQLAFDEHHRMGAIQDLAEQLQVGLEEVQARKDAEREELARRKDAEREAVQARKDAEREELARRKDAEVAELRADIEKLRRWVEESRTECAEAWAEVRRLDVDLEDALVGRDAVTAALEKVIEERNGWKWTVLQHERRPTARARQAVRRVLVGDEE
jgi:hypothetical protein